MKGDYTELYQVLKSGLNILSEEYENFNVSSFILFYSINHDNSILNKSILISSETKSN